MNKQVIGYAATAAVSLVTGAGTMYLIANARLKAKYEAIADEAIAETREHYRLLRKDGQTLTIAGREDDEQLEDAREVGRQILSQLGYAPTEELPDGLEDTEPETHNVFDNPEETPLDLESRSEDAPYIISIEEFMTEHDEDSDVPHEKITLVYFDKDDAIMDESEALVMDRNVFGEEHLSLFGQHSNNPDIVYVRNESNYTDFEIVRRHESFAKVVMGYDGDDEDESTKKNGKRK